MFSPDDLDEAIRANVITEETALALRNFSARAQGVPTASLERVSWTSGAAELLPTFGVLAVMVPLSGALFTGLGWPGALAGALICWGLAELLVANRRMMLPSFALFILFAILCGLTAFVLAMAQAGLPVTAMTRGPVRMPPFGPLYTAFAMAAASFAYWRRFGLPLAFACGAFCGLSALTHACRLLFPGLPSSGVVIVSLAVPVVLLALAIGWDMSDVRRETARSQTGFWLHVFAAYELVNRAALFLFGPEGERTGWSMIDTITTGAVSQTEIALYLLMLVCLGVLALALDRRSLLITGLLVSGPVMGKLVPAPVAIMLIGIAALVIALSWQGGRKLVLRLLPPIVQAQLPRTQIKFGRERPVA